MQKRIGKATQEELGDFEVIMNYLIEFISKHWDIDVKPKGYDEFVDGYEDYDGMEELDEQALKDEFNGFGDGTGGTFSFPIKISLPHTAYNDKGQGISPIETLLGAVLSHGMAIGDRRKRLQEKAKHERIKKDLEREIRFIKDEKVKESLKFILDAVDMNIKFD